MSRPTKAEKRQAKQVALAKKRRAIRWLTFGGGGGLLTLCAVAVVSVVAVRDDNPGKTAISAGSFKVAVERPQSVGIRADHVQGMTIQNVKIRGFDVAADIKDSSNLALDNVDLGKR